MAEKILYQFDGFCLDPDKRTLSRSGELRPLRPIAFDLLLALVESHGRTVAKSELIKRVWQSTFADDRNFHVTLHAVRQAIGDSAQRPRFIQKEPSGYRFRAEVRTIAELQPEPPRSRSHIAFVLFASAIYAALFAVALPLEVAYQFDNYGAAALKLAPLAFSWIMLGTSLALVMDRKLTLRDRYNGLIISVLVFLVTAGLLLAAVNPQLPAHPLTEATFRTYPARAAYLKDASLFLLLALIFLALPFHFVISMESEIESGRAARVLEFLIGQERASLPRGTIYPRFWILVCVLAGLALTSLITTAHLLDNLKAGTYMNLFVELVYLRGILYFGLGLICLAWYYLGLSSLKRQCAGAIRT